MAKARYRWRVAVLFVLVVMTGTMVSAPAGAQNTDDGDGFTLTILHNNDGESKLLPDGNADPGVARFVALMKQLQAGASGTGRRGGASGPHRAHVHDLATRHPRRQSRRLRHRIVRQDRA